MKVLHSITIAYKFGESIEAEKLAHRLMPSPEPEYKVEQISPGYVQYSWEIDHVIPGKVDA